MPAYIARGSRAVRIAAHGAAREASEQAATVRRVGPRAFAGALTQVRPYGWNPAARGSWDTALFRCCRRVSLPRRLLELERWTAFKPPAGDGVSRLVGGDARRRPDADA